jgi:peptidylprolyl isomerase/FKBP-type peptidyl-prolyl cis-trans isomerase FklB
MYKEIESGEGATPYFTDQVKVLYTGWFKREWSKSDTYTDDKGNSIYNKIIFDSTSNRNDIPSIFAVNGVVDGFSTALQHMQVGDKWEIWIPWKLGYGESGNNSIQGYTTLVFEIELVAIVE